MNKDTIIKVLLAIIALIIQIVLPIAVIVFAVKLFTKKK